MPLLTRIHPLLKRATAVLVCAWLLGAQFLLLSHAHAHEHGHNTHEAEPACAVCLFKASGHGDAAPLKRSAAMAMPAWPRLRTPLVRADAGVGRGWHFRKQARGPPSALRSN